LFLLGDDFDLIVMAEYNLSFIITCEYIERYESAVMFRVDGAQYAGIRKMPVCKLAKPGHAEDTNPDSHL